MKSRAPRFWALAGLLLVVGCHGGDATSSTGQAGGSGGGAAGGGSGDGAAASGGGTSGGTAGGGGGGPSIGGNAGTSPTGGADGGCFVAGTANPPYACALPQPCAQVLYTDPSEIPPGSTDPPTIDVAAARCVLQQIRDDVKSYLTVHQDLSEGFRDEFIWVQGDGTAILLRHYRLDLLDEPKLPRRFPRKEKTFFDTCLQETDPKAIHTCLTSWWVDDQTCFAADSLPCDP